MMEDSANYSIPVPLLFRCPPLVKLPWGAFSVPRLLAGADKAEEEFREKVKARYGVKHCILTDCARSAYAVYIQAAGLSGEIIMQSMMHTPTATLFMNHGLDVVFSDVARDFNMTREIVEPLVTPNPSAILVTHMFGRVAPIDRIEEWARDRSIKVLSNLVHMPGDVELKGRPVGSYGDVGFLSFNMDKPLNSIYGGALITNSDELYEKAKAVQLKNQSAKKIRQLITRYLMLYRYKPLLGPLQYLVYQMKGIYYKSDDVEKTFNSFDKDTYVDFTPAKIHPWQAAFASKLIEGSADMAARRTERARLATSLLSDVPEATPPVPDEYPNTYHYYPVLFDKSVPRYDLGVALARRGVEAKWRYYPLHLEPKFSHFRTGALDNTMEMWRSFLLMPVLYGTPKHVEYVVNAVKEAIPKVKKG